MKVTKVRINLKMAGLEKDVVSISNGPHSGIVCIIIIRKEKRLKFFKGALLFFNVVVFTSGRTKGL